MAESYATIALSVMREHGHNKLWIGSHDLLLQIWDERWPGRTDTTPGQKMRDVLKALGSSKEWKRTGTILSVGLTDKERRHAVFTPIKETMVRYE